MTTIRISKSTRKMIAEFDTEGTVDDKINELLDLFEPNLQEFDGDNEYTNVDIKQSTLDRLKTYKMSSYESHSDTLYRLLSEVNQRENV